MLTQSIALLLVTALILSMVAVTTVDGQQQPQSQQEDTTTTFESITDGFRIQVPNGWILIDINNTENIEQITESELGIGTLAVLCPQERVVPTTDGKQGCEPSYDSVYIFRVTDIANRSDFEALSNRNNNITVSDLLEFFRIEFIEAPGYSNFQLLNDTDTTVNFTDPQTNETIATIPAKLAEYTYEDSISYPGTQLSLRSFNLLTVNENIGYMVLHEGEISSLPSRRPPPLIEQIFDSFELVAAVRVAPAA
jgi:hypothetical protein